MRHLLEFFDGCVAGDGRAGHVCSLQNFCNRLWLVETTAAIPEVRSVRWLNTDWAAKLHDFESTGGQKCTSRFRRRVPPGITGVFGCELAERTAGRSAESARKMGTRPVVGIGLVQILPRIPVPRRWLVRYTRHGRQDDGTFETDVLLQTSMQEVHSFRSCNSWQSTLSPPAGIRIITAQMCRLRGPGKPLDKMRLSADSGSRTTTQDD